MKLLFARCPKLLIFEPQFQISESQVLRQATEYARMRRPDSAAGSIRSQGNAIKLDTFSLQPLSLSPQLSASIAIQIHTTSLANTKIECISFSVKLKTNILSPVQDPDQQGHLVLFLKPEQLETWRSALLRTQPLFRRASQTLCHIAVGTHSLTMLQTQLN